MPEITPSRYMNSALPHLLHAVAVAQVSYERLSTRDHPSLMRCTMDKEFVGYAGDRLEGIPDETLNPRAWAEAAHAMMVALANRFYRETYLQ